MDGTMDYAPKSGTAPVHPASTAGYYLQPQHADHRLHSPVPGSGHWNQNPSSSLLYPSASAQSHQHQQFHQHQINPAMVMEPYNHSHNNAPPVISRGFDGLNTSPTAYPQPVVQQVPTVSTTTTLQNQIPWLHHMEQYLQLRSEANKRFYSDMQQLLELQHFHYVERMKLLEQIIWNLAHQTSQQSTIAPPAPIELNQQEIPTAVLPNPAQVQNSVDFTAVFINQPQHLMSRPSVPVHSDLQQQQQQQQQQQSEPQHAIVHSIAVPASPGGISENSAESKQQHEHSAEVPKTSSVGSIESVIKINYFQPAHTGGFDADKLKRLKYMQHLLDRNGRRMDAPRRRSFVFSDVFKWMVNQGLIDGRPMLSVSSFPDIVITDHAINAALQPSSLFVNKKTVAMVNSVNQIKGGDVGNH